MINVIKPLMSEDQTELSDLSKIKNAIFLAGPCPRSNYDEQDWRTEAIAILEKLDTGNNDFVINVINPTNKYFDHTDLDSQSQWESEAMHYASAIFFNLNKSEDHPGFTTNFEIGEWFAKAPGAIFVYKPEKNKFGANNYIRLKCQHFDIPVYDDLEEALRKIYENVTRVERKEWVISDTHFGQERTLQYSQRPFIDVFEMDKNLISNWNKKVRLNDTVYHLGDFGQSADYIDLLNFRRFIFIEGNYERDQLPEISTELAKRPGVDVYKEPYLYTNEKSGIQYIMQHEPLSIIDSATYVDPNIVHLFGHIHGSQMIKKNGIDVGVDAHRYSPLDLATDVEFFRNALEKGYYDDQVFTQMCY